MFVRKKKIGNQEYYYLVETTRISGKPRQKVIRYLGKTKPTPEALKQIIAEVKKGV